MTFEIHSKKFGTHVVEIDDEDAEKVAQYTWHVHYCYRNGQPVLKGVRTDDVKNGKKRKLLLHRLICAGSVIDHKDGNVLNNRKKNLRGCSTAENACNTQKYKQNTSGFKGVSWHKHVNRFAAQIGSSNKKIHLGYFDTAEEAASAYNKAALKYHGEFARLNEI